MKNTTDPSEGGSRAREFLKSQAEIFKDFSEGHLQELVDGSSVRSFEPNEVIMHRGEICRRRLWTSRPCLNGIAISITARRGRCIRA